MGDFFGGMGGTEIRIMYSMIKSIFPMSKLLSKVLGSLLGSRADAAVTGVSCVLF